MDVQTRRGVWSFHQASCSITLELSRSHFKYHNALGVEEHGKVWKAEKRPTAHVFAIKEMRKACLVLKRQAYAVSHERLLLSRLKSSFIVNMHYAFQDSERLYLVLDLMEGNNLRHHICTHHFSEAEARFVIACIVLGLEYLHTNGIVHRDIRPENIIFDTRGYARIGNLAMARAWTAEGFEDSCGTAGYSAPEVMCRGNYGVSVDYFAIGVIAYEFMLGHVALG